MLAYFVNKLKKTGKIHLGFGKKIGYKTQLIEFPIENKKLSYFQFKLEESFNIQLNNFAIIKIDRSLEDFLKVFSRHPRNFVSGK